MFVPEESDGVWPASLVPFDGSLDIDEIALGQHITDLATTKHVKAIVVNGHASEATALTSPERQQVIRIAKEQCGNTQGVIAGVMGESTATSCAQAKDSEEAGADALLLFPPALFSKGVQQRGDLAIEYVREIATASSLPICLFQFPLTSGLGYPNELLIRICEEVDSVFAVKEGSEDPVAYETNVRTLRRMDRPIKVMSTNNGWLLSSTAVGGHGILSGMGSVAAEILGDLYAAISAEDLGQARLAADRLFPLTQQFYRPPFIDSHTRMKVALNYLGRFPDPIVRKPLLPITGDSEISKIRAAVDASGLEFQK